MRVPGEIRRIWNKKYEFGDIQAIHNHSGLATRTVYRAINEGACSRDTMSKITAFFKEKKEANASLIKQTIEDLS